MADIVTTSQQHAATDPDAQPDADAQLPSTFVPTAEEPDVVAQYPPGNEDWIGYPTPHRVQLLVICAKKSEWVELRRQVASSSRIIENTYDDFGRYFMFRGPNGVAVACIGGVRQGVQSSAIFITRALIEFVPETAVMLGSAAPSRRQREGFVLKGMTAGSAVVATSAFNRTEGKRGVGGRLMPDFQFYAMANMHARHSTETVLAAAGKDPAMMITDSAVNEDAGATFDEAQLGINRHAFSLDMESSSFFEACQQVGVSALAVIKGVSDDGSAATRADGGADTRTPMCIQSCINYLKLLVREHFPNVAVKGQFEAQQLDALLEDSKAASAMAEEKRARIKKEMLGRQETERTIPISQRVDWVMVDTTRRSTLSWKNAHKLLKVSKGDVAAAKATADLAAAAHGPIHVMRRRQRSRYANKQGIVEVTGTGKRPRSPSGSEDEGELSG